MCPSLHVVFAPTTPQAEASTLSSGQTIVLAHNPPRLTLHSLRSGREEQTLPIHYPSGSASSPPRITGVWWFKKEKQTDSKQLPDMFKRGTVVVCATMFSIRHSVFNLLSARLCTVSHKITAVAIPTTRRYRSTKVSVVVIVSGSSFLMFADH